MCTPTRPRLLLLPRPIQGLRLLATAGLLQPKLKARRTHTLTLPRRLRHTAQALRRLGHVMRRLGRKRRMREEPAHYEIDLPRCLRTRRRRLRRPVAPVPRVGRRGTVHKQLGFHEVKLRHQLPRLQSSLYR